VKISIITVCLNAAATIRDAVESVAAQSYPEIEHIVIDGGSTDGTMELLKSSNGRISRLVSEKDEGLYYAMNKGAGLCTGEVIGFLNADDVYASNSVLSKVADRLQHRSVRACYGDLEYVDKNNIGRTVRRWQSGGFIKGSFAKGWVPPHPAFFVRCEEFRRVGGFNTSLKFAADNELMMRLLEIENIETVYLREVLVKMRTGGATNRSIGNIVKGNVEIFRSLRASNIQCSLFSYILFKTLARAKHFVHANP
jgi:glycosyltransferase involved in cell wall biosynthesis